MALAEPARLTGALSRVRSDGAHLSKALRRLAEVVLADPQRVVYQTVTELADQAKVGEASVIRFCRDLGFKGFQDFKLALAADLALGGVKDGDAQTPPETPAEILERVLQEAAQALQETKALFDEATFRQVVSQLLQCRRLLVYGAGASGVTAKDFAYKFLRLGYSVIHTEDAHLAAMRAATFQVGDVVIGISRSGSTIDTLKVLEIAKQVGATTIALTHRSKSPASSVADYTLTTATSESPLTGGSIPAKMGQLLLLDALYATILYHRPEAEAMVAKTAQAVTDRNY